MSYNSHDLFYYVSPPKCYKLVQYRLYPSSLEIKVNSTGEWKLDIINMKGPHLLLLKSQRRVHHWPLLPGWYCQSKSTLYFLNGLRNSNSFTELHCDMLHKLWFSLFSGNSKTTTTKESNTELSCMAKKKTNFLKSHHLTYKQGKAGKHFLIEFNISGSY